MKSLHLTTTLLSIVLWCAFSGKANTQSDLDHFINILGSDKDKTNSSLKYLKDAWNPTFEAPTIESIRMTSIPALRAQLFDVLESKTNQDFRRDIDQWYSWLWNKPATYADWYFDFKSILYQGIDSRFAAYFENRAEQTTIRLDEVAWGGVRQDGIPPLRNPALITAVEAKFLHKNDLVFGLIIDGQARAYPKRILGWHELLVDQINDTQVTLAYCTLCGTAIAYNSDQSSIRFDLGTSGFLYRSNKLMYDAVTQSLWNTIEGKPVIGPLTQLDIELETFSVTTSPWGEWSKAYPDTKVLSLNTGHQRNYDEGAAYKDYYATDDLMFHVPKVDDRLANKAEVVAVRFEGFEKNPVVFTPQFLIKNPSYHYQIDELSILIETDGAGHFRAYQYSEKIKGAEIPTHRIFWFAWYAQFPTTKLITIDDH